MQTVGLFKRLTRKYRDGWSYLDNSEYLCDAKVTPPRLVREPDDYSDGGTYIMHATVPSGARPRDIPSVLTALLDAFSGSNCQHEHDCCGCALRLAEVRRVARNRYVVKQHITFNY